MRLNVRSWMVVLSAAPLLWAMVAGATPKNQKLFAAQYPATANTKLSKCGTCHTSKVPELNPYGKDLKAAHVKFDAVEKLDSDKDGASNLDEIKALTLPGDPKDKPAASAADSSKKAPADSSRKAPADSGSVADTTKHGN